MAKDWISEGSITFTANTTDENAPNATATALKLGRTTAESYIYRENEVTCEEDVYYTVGVFAKVDSANRLVMQVGDLENDFYSVTFNLTDNRVESEVTKPGRIYGTTSSLIAIGSGWYSCQVGFAFNQETELSLYLTPRKTGAGLTGIDTAASVIYLWEPSIEKRRHDNGLFYLGSAYYDELVAPDEATAFIPVWGGQATSVEYQSSIGNRRTISVAKNDDFDTNEAVQYVKVPEHLTDGFPSSVVINESSGPAKRIRITRQDKYSHRTPMRITFINRRGVLEDIWFMRKSEASLSVERDKYFKNVIDYSSLTYSTTDHSNQTFNVVGKKMYTLNTGFMPETQNALFEEMMMSEQVWLTTPGSTIPVIPKDRSFTYKTHVNDKLVQYTMTFEDANRLANTVT